MGEGAAVTVRMSGAGLDGLWRRTVMITLGGHASRAISARRNATEAADLMVVVGEAARSSLLLAAAGLNSLGRR